MAQPSPINSRRPVFDYNEPLPYNREAERAVLGAALLDNHSFDVARRLLKDGHFMLPENQKIFRAMRELAEKQSPIDTVTLMEELDREKALEAAGGVSYLSTLADGLPRSTNVEHYAKIVKEKSRLRELMSVCGAVQGAAQQKGANLEELVKQFRAAVDWSDYTAGEISIVQSFGLMDFLQAALPTSEHLIEGMIPKSASVLIIAKPHHLKSWFTLALTIGASVQTELLGVLPVRRPLRTFLWTVEDPAKDTQQRAKWLAESQTFSDVDPANIRIRPRAAGSTNLMNEQIFTELLTEVKEHKTDLLILDVLRRFFAGDINAPRESAEFCEQLDRLRDITGCALAIVHHENRKQAELMEASAGSFNMPAWANSVMRFSRKRQAKQISSVEIEVDNKLGPSMEPHRLILDLNSPKILRMESVEDGIGILEVQARLADTWTVRDLSEVLEIHRSGAYKRLDKMVASGVVEKIKSGTQGKTGGLARYCFVSATSVED